MNKNSTRPIDLIPRKNLAKAIDLMRMLFGGDRFNLLIDEIQASIDFLDVKPIKLLDYGCGNMSFSKELLTRNIASCAVGTDLYLHPNNFDNPNISYVSFDGFFQDCREKFDVTILIDVLHHIEPHLQKSIVNKLLACSRYLIIKDHFESSFQSRLRLIIADWFGNFAYGVTIPRRYFSRKSWSQFLLEVDGVELKLQDGVKVHKGIFGVIIPKHYHFISILKSKEFT